MEKGMMFIALAASAAAATIKIRNLSVEQMREIKAKREFNENKAAVLEAAKEELATRDQPKEEKPIELYPYQKKMMARMIKYFREREEEEKKLRKWNHYAKHAKKWRTRKKYQKRIREYYSKRTPRGGNWSYGSGAGIFLTYPRMTGEARGGRP